jgi:hypothetical protein
VLGRFSHSYIISFARKHQDAREACARCVLQVHHLLPLFTPRIRPEKEVCGSLTACVDVARSHTLSLNRNGEGHLLSEKGLNSVTQAISPRHQQRPEGAPRGEGRARASSGTRRGAPKPALGALCR